MIDRRNEPLSSESPASGGADSDRQLETARREAVAWVLAGLMHETRNALQQIGSCAEMLAIQLADRPAALDLIQGMEEAQARLVRMLDDLRTYSAPLEPTNRPIVLAALWQQAWQKLGLKGRWPDAELHEQAVPADTRCHADPAMLSQTFAILLERALDAGGPSPQIEIACQETLLHSQPALSVTIVDHGRRLTSEENRQLFDPFFCPQTRGTGLGMAIARRLIELHGGELYAVSPADRGNELVLTLPRRPTKKP